MFFDPIHHSCHILFYPFSPQEELERFHSKVTETFSPLKAGLLSENLLEVSERVARVVLAPFIYLVLGVLSCIEWTFQRVASLYQPQPEAVHSVDEEEVVVDRSAETDEVDQVEEEIVDLSLDGVESLEDKGSLMDDPLKKEADQAQIEIQTVKVEKVKQEEKQSVTELPVRLPEKQEDIILDFDFDFLWELPEERNDAKPQPSTNSNSLNCIPHFDAMCSIKRSRLDNVEEELKRLKNQGTLTLDLERVIDVALKKVNSYKFFQEPSIDENRLKMLLGRALEIKNLYQDTHYVFTHAQATKYFASVCLIKELIKVFFPERNVKFAQFLRVPHLRTTEVKDFKSILADAAGNSVINDHEGEVREKLLSADAYLFNAENGESALNFLSRNYSVLDATADGLKNLFSSTFSHFLTKRIPAPLFKDLSNRMLEIASRTQGVCGNLFVICVPKKLVEEADKTIVYRAHGYGKPCDCHPVDKDIEILQQLQKNNIHHDYLCRGPVIPQFRLLAAALTPENQVYSFRLTPFTRAEKKKLREEIAKVAADAYKAVQSVV